MKPKELSARYELLCQSTCATPPNDLLALRLAPHQAALHKLLNEDLRVLGRQGSPDDFADICFELLHELDLFEDICSFPALSQKFVVAFGGGFSAGKSSLINALLGKRLLVTEVDPTTALPTYLLAGKDDAIRAKNLFGHLISLSDAEFLSLTHDEVARYGSNISQLLHAAFITRQDFPWANLALIDTPGYSRHEDKERSERTDEHVSRTQLNSAQAIVWVIDARQGAITEEDLKFLGTLQPGIPRLVVVSRADQKTAEDVASIVAGIRKALETRNVPFLDVVAVSSRQKEWPVTAIIEQLESWNASGRELRFAHNFNYQFIRYMRFLENEQRQANLYLNRLNRILALADETAIRQDAQELKARAEGALQASKRLHSELATLRHHFFVELNTIGKLVDIPVPEPDALELLVDEGFDLLQALRRQRETKGRAAPDEPATLRELSEPGDAQRLNALLEEGGLNMHYASKLDEHCRQIYACLLAAVLCQLRSVQTDATSKLFFRILNSLGLGDIRSRLFDSARAMTDGDFAECWRILAEHGLSTNLLFDTLILSRSGGVLSDEQVHLFAELGASCGLDTETMSGLPILAGYVLGLHTRTEYTSPKISELRSWHPVIFKKMKRSDLSKGKVSGYFFLEKNLTFKTSRDRIEISDCLIISEMKNEIKINRPIDVYAKNSSAVNMFFVCDNPTRSNHYFWGASPSNGKKIMFPLAKTREEN